MCLKTLSRKIFCLRSYSMNWFYPYSLPYKDKIEEIWVAAILLLRQGNWIWIRAGLATIFLHCDQRQLDDVLRLLWCVDLRKKVPRIKNGVRFKFFIEFSINYTIQDYRSQCYYEAIKIIIRNIYDDIWFSSTSTELLFLTYLNII